MSQTKAQLVFPVGILTALGMSVSGVVTAANFIGDGSGIINVTGGGGGGGSPLIVKDDGALVGYAATIDFGSNISVSPASAGIVTVSVNIPADNNTTYTQTATTSGSDVNIRLAGSDSSTNDILLTAGTNISFSSVTSNGFTINNSAVYDDQIQINNNDSVVGLVTVLNYGSQLDVSSPSSGISTITLANTTVVAGSYVNPTISVDAQGRITSAASGPSGSGGALGNIVEDATPQLGGDLDLNSNSITGTGNINVTGIATVSGTVNAQNFNTTSDARLKENVATIENSIGIITSIRGVTFDWIGGGESSVGVIAQEVEAVLPEIVSNGDTKQVNYNGLIGVLIEAVKELKVENDNLKEQIQNIINTINT